jgi:hypothetical protein
MTGEQVSVPDSHSKVCLAEQPTNVVKVCASHTCSSAVERSRALWVELANGRRIEVAHGFDASTLELLVAVLDTPASKDRLPGTPSLARA